MTPPPRPAASRPASCPTPARPPGGRARLRTVGTLLALVGLLTGCGLRLETPPPAPLTPDVNEAARQRASADALGLEVVAAPGTDPADPTAAVRAVVVAQAGEHLDQLGGIYVSNAATPEPSADPSSTAVATADPAVTPPDAVLAQLTVTAANARTDALAVPDSALARLLASVATERLLIAQQLAAAAGLPAPELAAVTVPDAAPAGISPSVLSALVAGEDEAGYGFEVIAAKLSDAARTAALDRSAVHRARAEEWATLAEIARTGFDPRRTVYALPTGLDDPAVATTLAQTLEQSLAATYASLVADAEPASRAGFVDSLAEATAAAGAWGAPVPAFPGLPERTAAG